MRPLVIVGVFVAALLSACGAPTTGSASTGPSSSAVVSTAPVAEQDTGLQPVLATSEIVVGPNRIAIGILDNKVPLKDMATTALGVRYFRLDGNDATPLGEEQARYFGEGLGERGTFVVRPTFDRAGDYGLELDIRRQGQEPVVSRISVTVTDAGAAPRIGSPAPPSDTPTAADVADLHLLSSATEPDPRLYQQSVAQAVGSGKPSLILFATPGYCSTQVCGPGVDVLQKLIDRFGAAFAPVHVEVYKMPYESGLMVPAMREWNLQTEPWLFLVDGKGTIAGRFEGGITFEELEPEVAKLLGQ